jgi:hypothetical protein
LAGYLLSNTYIAAADPKNPEIKMTAPTAQGAVVKRCILASANVKAMPRKAQIDTTPRPMIV